MPESASPVIVIQCTNPKCRKYMMVEENQHNQTVPCLLCRTPIKVDGKQAGPSQAPGR